MCIRDRASVAYAEEVLKRAIAIRDENAGSQNRSVLKQATDFIDGHYMDCLLYTSFTLKSDLGELAQLPVSVFLDNIHKMTVSVPVSYTHLDVYKRQELR